MIFLLLVIYMQLSWLLLRNYLAVHTFLSTFAPRKQCSGLPLVVTREESPGSAGHPTCESTSSRRRLDMGEENDRQWLWLVLFHW